MDQARQNKSTSSTAQQSEPYEYPELSEEDASYLISPRNYPEPCLWCGGRLVHARLCVTNSDEFQPRLKFGKHKNRPVREVEPEYLRWALNSACRMTPSVLGAAIEVVRSSGEATPAEIASWEERLRLKELRPEGELE